MIAHAYPFTHPGVHTRYELLRLSRTLAHALLIANGEDAASAAVKMRVTPEAGRQRLHRLGRVITHSPWSREMILAALENMGGYEAKAMADCISLAEVRLTRRGRWVA